MTTSTDPSFEDARSRFPVLERVAYLNAGTFGPLARGTLSAVEAELRCWGEEGRSGPAYVQRYRELRQQVRAALAAQVGVTPELVALTGSTTEGCNIVLAGLDLGPEDDVVTTDGEHFGLLGPLLASRARLRIARVGTTAGPEAQERILAAITPRTRLLAVSHVSWVTGHRLDVGALRRESGLPVLVDGAQAAGAIPVDATGVDFYTISAQKWLCAPESTAALVVADPQRLRVALPGHFSQASHDRARGTWEPQPGAARFDAGWIPVPSLAGLLAALSNLPSWRFRRAAATAARCRELLRERWEVVTAPDHSTLVSFRARGDPAELAARLFARGVVVRELPATGLLRVSCGWWTSDEDLARLVEGLAARD